MILETLRGEMRLGVLLPEAKVFGIYVRRNRLGQELELGPLIPHAPILAPAPLFSNVTSTPKRLSNIPTFSQYQYTNCQNFFVYNINVNRTAPIDVEIYPIVNDTT